MPNVSLSSRNRFLNYYFRDLPEVTDDQWTIAVYGSHNAAIVVAKGKQVLEVIEAERFYNYKNGGIAQYKVPPQERILPFVKRIKDYITRKYTDKFDVGLCQNSDVVMDDVRYRVHEMFESKTWIDCLHHRSHASGAFYQSPFKRALCISADGGGNDGSFNVYVMVRGEEPHFLYEAPHDLGFPYMLFGQYLNDIKYEQSLSQGNLVYPGKIMGLASYGKVRDEWLPHFIEFYLSEMDGPSFPPVVARLGEQIGVTFDVNARLEGEVAYDVAATSQRAFEEAFLILIKDIIEDHKDWPICLTGGCALNITFNTRLAKDYQRQVFVGPNPNDCGIALGMMLDYLRPKEPFDATYIGTPLLDGDSLIHHVYERTAHVQSLDIDFLADKITEGKIFGVAHGRSEHGPRALGNRSIICNPSFPQMKDILNAKVKHREWYRPFAPIVRLEDVNKYFEWDQETRWMSFCPMVRHEYREKLPSITHVDGTARVQTVTREQNPLMYDLITAVEKRTGIGVLLNTSFNVDGKPILTTCRDAFEIYDKTDIDGLVIEDLLIMKN